jgi:predicted PhzF superfamily epimerase YddE/YHI9
MGGKVNQANNKFQVSRRTMLKATGALGAGLALEKNELTARQLSKRRGWLKCRLAGNRVEISGQARAYMAGEINLD